MCALEYTVAGRAGSENALPSGVGNYRVCSLYLDVQAGTYLARDLFHSRSSLRLSASGRSGNKNGANPTHFLPQAEPWCTAAEKEMKGLQDLNVIYNIDTYSCISRYVIYIDHDELSREEDGNTKEARNRLA